MRKGKPGQVFGVAKNASHVKKLADELLDIHAEARAVVPIPLPGDE
jgi:hypothetical protein